MIEELIKEMREDIKEMKKDIVQIKLASAKRDGKLYVVIAAFGAIGGAVMDVIRRKFLG